ncbi:MAG: hypothetical protein RI907_1466 [Pseudomonadota bacterium]|jgi:hypothetical protein
MTPNMHKRLALYGCLVAAAALAWFAPPASDDVAVSSRTQALTASPGVHAPGAAPAMPTQSVLAATASSDVMPLQPRGAWKPAAAAWSAFGRVAVAAASAPAATAARPPVVAASRPTPAVVMAAASAASSPEPTAPPLPFRFLGRASQAGQDKVFLAWGEHNLIVAEGDAVATHYRVLHIESQAVTFKYLPLNVVQQLDTRGGNQEMQR